MAGSKNWLGMEKHQKLLCVIFMLLSFFSVVQPQSSSSCPLNFTVLDQIEYIGNEVKGSLNTTFRCTSFVQALHFVLVDYVDRSGFFLVPDSSAIPCWNALDQKLSSLGSPVNVQSLCNFSTSSISRSSPSCLNITSIPSLQLLIPQSTLSDISSTCANASPQRLSTCSACNVAVVQNSVTYFRNPSNASIVSCQDILSLYAASTAPNASRADVASCLFNIVDSGGNGESKYAKYIYSSVGAVVALLAAVGLLLFIYLRRRKLRIAKQKREIQLNKEKLGKSNRNLTWYTMDEMKRFTNNFARSNIVGTGAFGNVYKGKLSDGTEIAVKRFKNCSPAGDDDFFHEIEVISTVRHRNLVALRGCCVDKTDLAGYQRIIVYDYIPNGNLYEHLFTRKTDMDWPKRQNIAIGIVRGLVYLHQEVQPAIIHRDIKPSNVLLDANWNARLADFGLAKFTPDGATHISTRVAGTHGYVAPEYVLYGQLTEKSDVYSLGIVLLELFTGKKILDVAKESEGSVLITDWAWSLIKQGRVADVIDSMMHNLDPPDVIERFILLALLCSHPLVPCRPTIDRVLKIMENDQPLPAIPDRPIAYSVGIADIERAAGGSGALSSCSGFQSFSSHGSSLRHPRTSNRQTRKAQMLPTMIDHASIMASPNCFRESFRQVKKKKLVEVAILGCPWRTCPALVVSYTIYALLIAAGDKSWSSSPSCFVVVLSQRATVLPCSFLACGIGLY